MLTKFKIKTQHFGIAEQVLISATNMAISLVVVKTAGIEWFGIYSFILVLTALMSALFSTLLHRQMILTIASSTSAERRKIFVATLTIQAAFIFVVGSVLALLVGVFSESRIVSVYGYELIAAVIYVGLYNFHDLCRQYLYVLDKQAYSFRCTLVYLAVLVAGVVFIVVSAQHSRIVVGILLVLSLALFLSLLSNRKCYDEYAKGEWVGSSYVVEVLNGYFEHGRFRLVGTLLTWAQNQSMNPVLMWLGGPLVAGYFSMARLMVMPVLVVNHGLTNSTTPELRRVFESSGAYELYRGIHRYIKQIYSLSLVYLILILIAHTVGLLDKYIPGYETVQWFFIIWVATLFVTLYRHWLTQYFVVSMQFQFLMNVSIAALAVSMSGMIGAGYVLGNVYIALIFVIIGELLSILMFKRRLARVS